MVNDNTTEVPYDENNLGFKNWLIIVFFYVRITLFLVSAIAAVIAILLGIFLLGVALCALFCKAWELCTRQHKAKRPVASQNPTEEHPLEQRNIGDEEAAEQLVIADGDDAVGKFEDLPPTYDGKMDSTLRVPNQS